MILCRVFGCLFERVNEIHYLEKQTLTVKVQPVLQF